ncbi:unnamed protein product [Scytosiphon promiscuus]
MLRSIMTAWSPLLALLLAAALGVEGFVLQPHAVASAPAVTCGGTSFVRQHAAEAASHSSRAKTVMNAATGQDGKLSRGALAGRVLGLAVTGAVAVTQGPGVAVAEVGVGEGGLPDGARQFSNLVKVQRDWAALGKSIKDQGASVTPEEWKNVALFLRKVYQLGGDLEYLAGTFPSDKKKAAVALVRAIQKEVQAADVPAREKNAEAFLTAQVSVEKKFAEFMELFNDVPSEL